ncbi:MAG TPA: type II toxin-antitoxin system HicA family toxin [Bacteroidales bacterium]|nr:type II toxin-antitoxin system HicA family toxin [Bacteroidales bacterium]
MKKVFKVREVIRIIESLGWYLDRQKGTSHRQYKHPTIRSTVTINGKFSDDVWIGNLKSIEKQTGIRFKDFAE